MVAQILDYMVSETVLNLFNFLQSVLQYTRNFVYCQNISNHANLSLFIFHVILRRWIMNYAVSLVSHVEWIRSLCEECWFLLKFAIDITFERTPLWQVLLVISDLIWIAFYTYCVEEEEEED
jgi:hypothetical protein